MSREFQRVHVIDTHTGGEPTRVVIAGGPDLGRGTLAERRTIFLERHDQFRSAIVNEPRGSDVMVGALVVEPVESPATAVAEGGDDPTLEIATWAMSAAVRGIHLKRLSDR